MENKFADKISIIVPLYNVEKYLDNAIRHLLNQTYTNLEIILVDDGSTDSSGQMCDEYAAQDSRIRVIHKKNGGTSSARNCGIEAATGDYIGFLDADDYVSETMYEVLHRTINENNCIVAQVMFRYIDEEGKEINDPYPASKYVGFLPRSEMFRLLMLHIGDSSLCTKLIRADFMKKFRFEENRLNEDFELVLRMLGQVDGVYSVGEVHYNILVRQGSNQRSGFKPHLYEAMIDNSDFAFSIMEKDFTQFRTETIRFRFFQRLDYLLHIPVEQMTRDNVYYQKIVKEIRQEKALWKNNPYLNEKEKRNLMILSLCPKLSKRVHRFFMKLKGIKK